MGAKSRRIRHDKIVHTPKEKRDRATSSTQAEWKDLLRDKEDYTVR